MHIHIHIHKHIHIDIDIGIDIRYTYVYMYMYIYTCIVNNIYIYKYTYIYIGTLCICLQLIDSWFSFYRQFQIIASPFSLELWTSKFFLGAQTFSPQRRTCGPPWVQGGDQDQHKEGKGSPIVLSELEKTSFVPMSGIPMSTISPNQYVSKTHHKPPTSSGKMARACCFGLLVGIRVSQPYWRL